MSGNLYIESFPKASRDLWQNNDYHAGWIARRRAKE
jgi:hypothetical protein